VCLALIELAHQQSRDGPVRLGEIARAQGLPQSTLTQVCVKPSRAHDVVSASGTGCWFIDPNPQAVLKPHRR
jgi:DNA-binding IscR family transcriptional regulator